MISLETVTQFMLEHFQQTKITNGGQHFLARCVLCGDSKKNPFKKRFNLDWNNGVPGWHCFNCGESGSFYDIYGRLKGLSYEEVRRELHRWKDNEVKEYVRSKSTRPKTENLKEKVDIQFFNSIINDCYELKLPLSDNLGLMERGYLRKLKTFYDDRKISHKYKIYICYKGRYKNRIIIPIFDEKHNIIYFQARRIPKSGLTPKYDNPESPKELCILNRHNFNKDKYIIVHEGLIDAFMVGDQGTSCLGKEISKDLLQVLLSSTNKGVIIALDNDIEAYKSLARFLDKNILSRKLKYFIYPKKFEQHGDINEIVVNTSEDIDVYDMIVNNSANYSTAVVRLKLKGVIK